MLQQNKTGAAAVALGFALIFSGVQAACAAGDAEAGRQAFAKCASCHQVRIPRSSFGPHLHGVVGRPAAAATDFRYSEAMRKSGIVWTEEALRVFLRSPDKAVPGTSMRFRGVGNERELDDLLAYLRSVR
ncbi:MAG TPA: c-type cytochrome [Rhodocyclaceae bacterium]|nr:c-type cytochrome [Rhodocyclaceae bacterium]